MSRCCCRDLIARCDFSNLMLVAIANHPRYARQCCNLFWCSLGITARDQNFCCRIFTMDSANGGTCILIGRGGDSAGIEDDKLGDLWRPRRGKAECRKLELDGRSVSLSGSASKVLYEKFRHESIIIVTRDGTAPATHNQTRCSRISLAALK